jgi:integrase
MPTPKKSLTDATVRNLKAPGAYSAGTPRGLFLVVTPSGTKSWRLRYWVDGKEFVHTLGHFPTLTLAEARQVADKEKDQIKLGLHPKERRQAEAAAKKAEQALTFEGVAKEFIEHTKTIDGWAESTDKGHRYALKAINGIMGSVPVSKVDVDHIKRVITHYQGKKTAQRFAFGVIKRVLGFAKVSRYVKENIAIGSEGLLPKKKKGERSQGHHAAITEADALAEYLRKMYAFDSRTSSFYGLKLLTMLPVRPSELATMKWSDLELEYAVPERPDLDGMGRWVFEMSKVSREHIVPLPRQAVALLRELLARRAGHAEYVLPGRYAGSNINPESFRLALVDQLGYAVGSVTPHGFRATFQTLARKHLKVGIEVLELSLGHETSAAFRGAYDRNDFLEERFETAKRWADKLDEWRVDNDKGEK